MSLTTKLVEYIRQKPIEHHDLEMAGLFVLDAVANLVGGRSSDAAGPILNWAMSSAASNPIDAGRQALVMGGLIHSLETDDLHRTSVTHPGCVVVPVALSLGAQRQIDGHQLLTSVLHGFEAMCRIGDSVGNEHYRVWHNTGTCGTFGAAMTAASILSLNADQSVDALGNAGTQSAGLWEFLSSGAMSKHLHAGRAAESGIIAAEWAAHGFSGPSEILEGEKGLYAGACPDANPLAVMATPDADWQLLKTSIKPWPSCRHTHPAVDGALALSAQVSADDIAEIAVDTYQAAINVCDRPDPRTEYQAKFSLQHCVVAALIDGRLDFDSFSEQRRAQLGDLRAKVRLNLADPYASAYPDQYWGSGVTVRLRNGESLGQSRQSCAGDPEDPLDRDQMTVKARMLFDHGGMPAADAEALIDAIFGLAEGRADWSVIQTAFPPAIL
ncbi:MAG: MmgE/PrpD family protein [Pseudomonadota bacterium]